MSPEKVEPKIEAPVDKRAGGRFERPVVAEEQAASDAQQAIAPAPAPAEQITPDRDEELIMIENILSENISEIYRELTEAKKRAFREKGEEVAIKIKGLLKQAKIVVHDVLTLIKEWLKMLPHISNYFLEQETKIKTDKILQMKREGQKVER